MLFSNSSLRNGLIYRLGVAHQKMMASGVTKLQIAMARLLAFFSFLILSLAAVQTAHAQANQLEAFSVGDMLGGLPLPAGVTATATVVSTGTGAPNAAMGTTNLSPNNLMGGPFSDADTGFDEANRTIGLSIDTTVLHATPAASFDEGLAPYNFSSFIHTIARIVKTASFNDDRI